MSVKTKSIGVLDKLQNLVANLGTDQDKREFSRFSTRNFSSEELDAMYSDDWLSGKLIDIPVEDMLREGWKYDAPGLDADQIGLVEEEEKILQVKTKYDEVLKWSRLYGGAIVIMGIDGAGDPDEPLDVNRIKKGALKFLNVVDRFDLSVYDVNQIDPTLPNYRLPTYYSVFGARKIHESRILRFEGIRVPRRITERLNYWGIPVLQRVYDAIQNAQTTANSIASMTFEANIDVIKIDDLKRQLTTPAGSDALVKRFLLAKILKSNNNMLLLDQTETYDRKGNNIASQGLPGVLQVFLEIVSGAADVPATRLLGRAPEGLNSSGESQHRDYYDSLAGKQESILRPQHWKLNQVLVRSVLGTFPEDWSFEFNPLWQLSEKEQAEVEQIRANTDATNITSGIIAPALATGRLRDNKTYPDLTDEFVELVKEIDAEKFEEEPLDREEPAPEETPEEMETEEVEEERDEEELD
jgi:phage-related protein (TIGR01555 family)